ncbi:MAG: M23 family peptidase [Pseudolabrys sp.]|nr:M23 family peptidase [Pseudolabrys sp.]
MADEMHAPRFIASNADWNAAAKSLPDAADDAAAAFPPLNAALGTRFPGIEKSTVPVLLPIDLAAYRKDRDADSADAATSNKYFGDFFPSKFFLAGPAGYDVTFWIKPSEAGFKFNWPKPIEIELGGAAYTYDLDDPNHQEIFPPPKELADKFPGIKRILRENHVRYAFERFGVPYVVSIQCYDRRPSSKYISCREADPVAIRFLNRLVTVGGTPGQTIAEPKVNLARPTEPAKDGFSYYGPGDLIPNSGWHKMPGRADYTVYARVRFPMEAPAYIKSQSFLHWGDCYRTGHVGRLTHDAPYHCKVNDKPLVFNESNPENFNYPWRDNFCEMRDFLVGQCPGGYGHQGQDMRPSNCVIDNDGGDRCLPYQHTILAVHDGLMWRTPGNLGAYVAWNTADEHVRFRYLHMNPKMMDDDGLVTGRPVKEGEVLGKVATWGDYESGTSYHLHFNLQVFTKVGWVWVNNYMTLVASYENLIGGRGTEIKAGDPAPVIPDKPPVVLHPTPPPAATAEAKPAEPKSMTDAKPVEAKRPEIMKAEKVEPPAKKKMRRKKRHKRRSDDD